MRGKPQLLFHWETVAYERGPSNRPEALFFRGNRTPSSSACRFAHASMQQTVRVDSDGPMLEQQTLLLRPWTSAPDAGGAASPIRPILAPNGQLLGFACRPATASGWLGWLGWLARPVLAGHEAEDEPLLFTVHRLCGWTVSWDVHDADDHWVGAFRRRGLQDQLGHFLA